MSFPDQARLSNTRAGVLARLRELDGWVSVQELADALGQHRNTVRTHVDGLVEAGLVQGKQLESSGRGRPAMGYRAVEVTRSESKDYAQLAILFAERLAAQGDPDAASELGRAWAQTVVADMGEEPQHPVSVMQHMGFEPRVVDEHTMELHRCPVLRVSATTPQIMCAMHAHLVTELMAAQGLDGSETVACQFAEPGRCQVKVGPAPLPLPGD